MRLLIVRHAIAEKRSVFARAGTDDALRPLTPEGAQKMRQVADGLRRLVDRIDFLASSPLLRAKQTAEILTTSFPGTKLKLVDELIPTASHEALLELLLSLKTQKVVTLVGHEPHLSESISWLLSGQSRSLVELKKGGACMIEFDAEIAPGAGTLTWLLPPAMLRKLGSSAAS
jgi:phosphohistidine phosphatase